MTPTQESIRKLSDKELIAQLKIVRSVQRRFDFREKWICEEMERRSRSHDQQTTTSLDCESTP